MEFYPVMRIIDQSNTDIIARIRILTFINNCYPYPNNISWIKLNEMYNWDNYSLHQRYIQI